jgi:hypothetical protein
MEAFTISASLPATPEQIYKAWLSSEGHSQMIGSQAEVQEGKRWVIQSLGWVYLGQNAGSGTVSSHRPGLADQ